MSWNIEEIQKQVDKVLESGKQYLERVRTSSGSVRYFNLREGEQTTIKIVADESGWFYLPIAKHIHRVGNQTLVEICPALTAQLQAQMQIPRCVICQAANQYPQYKAFVPSAYMYFFVIDGKQANLGTLIWSMPHFRGIEFLSLFRAKLKEVLDPKGLVFTVKRVRNDRNYLDYVIIDERQADLTQVTVTLYDENGQEKKVPILEHIQNTFPDRDLLMHIPVEEKQRQFVQTVISQGVAQKATDAINPQQNLTQTEQKAVQVIGNELPTIEDVDDIDTMFEGIL